MYLSLIHIYLMLLSKMIRAACDNEKTMRTYLGKIEYIKLFWEGAPEGEPLVRCV